MAYGPQYSSQLGLLAGALGHGLDPTMGLDIYQQTIAQAEAARAQAQAERQETLAKLASLGMDQAASGVEPESIEALMRTAAAGLPRGDSNTVRQGMHKILGNLQDYEAPVDPMAQLELENAQLTNLGLQQDLMGGGEALDPSEETVYGPAHEAQVAQLTELYLNQGMKPEQIRGLITRQLLPQLAPDTETAAGTPSPPAPGIADAINRTISATVAELDPAWAQTNLVNYGAPAPAPPPPSPSPTGAPASSGQSFGDYWDTVLGALGTFSKIGFL